jgi:hypothetical protein
MLVFLAATTVRAESPPPTVTASPGKGLSVSTDDGKYSIGVRARFQIRESVDTTQPDDDGHRDVTMLASVRTLRLYLYGTVLDPDLAWLVQIATAQYDYRDGTTSPVFDAYVDYTRNPNLSLKVGQYFVPFDRLRTVKESALQMADRPKPVSELTLDRDVGVTLYSTHLGGENSPLGYKVGVFGGGGIDTILQKEPGRLGVARLELRPFGAFDDETEGDLQRSEDPGLLVGVGAAYNLNTNRVKSTTGAFYTAGTADYLSLDADAMFKVHGFAAEAEYLVRQAGQDEIRGTDADGNRITETTISGRGLVTQASMMLTAHHEVVARYTKLWAPDGTDPTWIDTVEAKGNEAGAGVNWYLNGHKFKIQADGEALFGDAFSDAEYHAHLLLDASF